MLQLLVKETWPFRRLMLGTTWIAVSCLISACAGVKTTGTASVANSTIAFSSAGNAGPVVVFESGLGDGKDAWASVLPTVANNNRVFAYDRPGYGASPRTDTPRDPCTIASEERELLLNSGLMPPYILVGHSAGGLYQYVFAKLYPQDVAGIVLVDPTHPDHWAAMQREAPSAASVMKTMRSTLFSSTERREFDEMASCNARLNMSTPLRVPARVLVRTKFEGMEAGAFEQMSRHLQSDWGRLAGVDRVEPINGAGHYIQKDRPQAVIDAIASIRQQSRIGAWQQTSH